MTSSKPPLILSPSKDAGQTRAPRACFDKLSMGGVGIAAGLAVLAFATPAFAKPQPKPGFEPALPVADAPQTADGSIFNASTGYAALIEGHRARRVGDPVTILLVESVTTSKSARGKTQRNGDFSVTPPTSGPFSFDPNALKASGQSSFNGAGNASQTSALDGELYVTIAEVRPGGTALVRGEKRMLLSQGKEWIQFSGIVRLADLTEDNRILSTRVADAKIEYSGKGSVQRAGREGWLLRFFNIISPF